MAKPLSPEQIELARLLSELRKAANVQQKVVARRAICSEPTISYVFSGERACKEGVLAAIFQACKPSIEQENAIIDAYNLTVPPRDALRVGFWCANIRDVEFSVGAGTVISEVMRNSNATSFQAPEGADKRAPEPQLAERELLTGGDYIVDTYEEWLNLPSEPGKSYEQFTTREIVALRDGAVWRGSSRIRGRNVSGEPLHAELVGSPGKLSIIHDVPTKRGLLPGHINVMQVTFNPPLKQGQHIRFTIRQTLEADFARVVRKGSIGQQKLPNIKTSVRHAKISVRFPFSPDSVWHFEDVEEWRAPGLPTEANRLVPDNSGFVTYPWDDLLRGYSYGIAWQW